MWAKNSRATLLITLVLGSWCLLSNAHAQTHISEEMQCRKAKDANEKIATCTAAIRVTNDRRLLERFFLRRGNAYVEAGRYSEAIEDFSNLIKINPRVAGYYDNRLNAFRELHLFREAINDANTVIQMAPGYAMGYRGRGLVYEATSRYQEAIDDFSRALAVDPSNVGLVIDRARIKTEAGLASSAINDLTAVLTLDPNNIDARKFRAKAYIIQNNTSAARADLSTVTQLRPDDTDAKAMIAALEASPPSPLQQQPSIASPRSPSASSIQQPKEKVAEPSDGATISGTGFFITGTGHVVTNAHVVRNCSTARVTAGLNYNGTGNVIAKDTANDLALLKVDMTPASHGQIRLGARTGENIAAFGFPLYGLLASNGNFTVGNISAVQGLGDDSRYLQISAPIQPGNSGGPVLDQSGNIVGVVVSKLNVMKVASAIDDMPQNVNFAIKSSVLTNFLETTGVAFEIGSATKAMTNADLADAAKSLSVLIRCGG